MTPLLSAYILIIIKSSANCKLSRLITPTLLALFSAILILTVYLSFLRKQESRNSDKHLIVASKQAYPVSSSPLTSKK
ncbi:hypothetical protein MCHI_000081 [Candidatus Magnetoovum chiemensis]|nr:hypothetical protein MCHI_000081 [Candidatus Magnetoovum chiemensis]